MRTIKSTATNCVNKITQLISDGKIKRKVKQIEALSCSPLTTWDQF